MGDKGIGKEGVRGRDLHCGERDKAVESVWAGGARDGWKRLIGQRLGGSAAQGSFER